MSHPSQIASQAASQLRAMLLAGAPRSIGGADDVVALVLAEPAMLGTLLACLCAEDRRLVARAANAAEKLSRQIAPGFQRHKGFLLDLLSHARQPELRWQLALILPRLQLSVPEAEHCAAVFQASLKDRSSLVKTFAMQGLVDLLRQNPAPHDAVIELLQLYSRSGTAAMRARGRILLKQLESAQNGRATKGREERRKVAG